MQFNRTFRDLLSRPATRRLIDGSRRSADVLLRHLQRLSGSLNYRYVSIAAAAVLLGLVAIAADVVLGSPRAREIRALGHMPVATVVFDRHDEPAFTISQERRYELSLGEMSPHLVQAVLAIEDQRFYRHRGLDLWRIAGSMWSNARTASLEQGASTITQQLAKLSWLTPEKTFRRKLREAYLAVRIEHEYTKDEILEIYLNKVYFGSGYYGAEAAARGYFGKHASDLSVAEAALLAGIIQRPSAYAPDQHMELALARRGVVLAQMVEAGVLDRATAAHIEATPVTLEDGFTHERNGAYFRQAVTRALVERFGWETISSEGLRVFTTYDPVAQIAAEKSLVEGLTEIEERTAFSHEPRDTERSPTAGDAAAPDYLQGALVALDARSGEVRALVGGRDYADSQFDRVTQATRQSGSVFKPFVYAAAFEKGFSPATLVTDLDTPISTPEGPWLPDEGHAVPDTITTRAALRTSSNRAAARLLQEVGVSEAVHYAGRMGLVAPPVPSLVLGTGEVTLMGLTAAYGAFADGGQMHTPTLIRRVEDAQGRVLMESEHETHRVVSEQTAFQISSILSEVIDRGTGYKARQAGFRLPAAGKTGTTNEYRDAWFVGYTPDLVAGVWVGFDQPRTIISGGYASELAVPIWGAFMRDATEGAPARRFERPSGLVAVEICMESGLLPGATCHRVQRVSDDGESQTRSLIGLEYFRIGTEPTDECPLHRRTWFGGVRTASYDPSDFPGSSTLRSPSAPSAAADASDEAPEETAGRDEDTSQAEEKEEKRGFWSRFVGVFRGGDRDGDRDSDRESDD